MKKNVRFAIMQYVPSFERDEKLNVAVILHCPSEKFMKIKIIKNFKRLKEFDDELHMDFIKSYFKSLENAFTYDFININNLKIEENDLLEQITKFYINQFTFKVFDNVVIETSCDNFLNQLKDNYLYLDEKKDKRISKKQSIKFFTELLNGKNIQYELINNNNYLLGNFNEKINVDLKIEKKYYKIINFNENNIDKYTPTIKMWMLNAIELREKDEELIFVINEQVLDEKSKMFIEMLSKYGKVLKLDEFNEYFK